MSGASVRTGLDCLIAQRFAPLRGLSVGLVTHPAAVDGQLRHIRELLADASGVRLAALFGPEHGLMGEEQDLIGVGGGTEADSSLRIHSLYGDSFAWRRETYEFVSDRPAIDLLFGSDRERQALEAGMPATDICRAWEAEEDAFRQRRRPYLIY